MNTHTRKVSGFALALKLILSTQYANVAGEFDNYTVLFIGGTLRYVS